MKLLTVVFAAMFAASVFADGVRYPIQDTSVSSMSKDGAYWHEKFLRIGNGFDACVMLPVSGLANVTSAKFKFYVSQCGNGAKYPLYFRVMRDDRWHHNMLTWNALPDEFRFRSSALLDQADPSLAGYIEIENGVDEYEVDITKAVKAAAPRGRLALHVFTSWVQSVTDNTTLTIESIECETASQRPYLSFAGDADASDATMTVVASADTHIQSWSAGTNYGGANDAVMADRDGREAFVKFDLSGVDVDHVDSAMLLLYTYPSTYQPTLNDHVYTSDDGIQFQLTEKTDWDEMDLTWNNAYEQTGCAPGFEKNGYDWQSNVPANAVRGPSSATDKFYRIDVAKLVNQVLAVGGKTLSLRIIRNPNDSKRYFFFCPREYANEAHRPRLLVTPKVDAKLVSRKALQDTFVGNGSAADKSYFLWMLNDRNPPWTYLQVGCSGTAVQYGLMLFDPAGLENADFVRLRIQSRSILPECDGALRVTAWQSDRWNATNLTWNTLSPWFPQPTAVVQGTALDGEIASLKPTQTRAGSYIELDVTSVAKSAAKARKHITIGLFSNGGWPEIYRGESAYPAEIVFPDPDGAFGNRVTCSLDQEGGRPTLRLAWSPSAADGATYKVERRNGDDWKIIASGLATATCVDPHAEPNVEHTYRITDLVSGGTVVKSVALDATFSVYACADTYVQNGGSANNRFGTGASLVHKYDAGNGNGGVREGFYRFDVRNCPDDFKSATLKLHTTGSDGGHNGNEEFWVLTYPDFEWTDDIAPSWNSVFGNGYATPQVLAGNPDGDRSPEYKVVAVKVPASLTGESPLEFDVAGIIRAAKANGQSHVTLHTCAYDPNSQWNFGIISRERAQGVSWGPQIEFKLRNWVNNGFNIIIK